MHSVQAVLLCLSIRRLSRKVDKQCFFLCFVLQFFSNHSRDQCSGRSNAGPLVICRPSGVGKKCIIDGLMKRYSNLFGFSVSHTTRLPRPGEVHGDHYYFITLEEMQQQIMDGKFVEYAQVHGNLYGTSKQAAADFQRKKKITILSIDRQGVISVKESQLPAKFIFIAPPSMDTLEERLRGRANRN
jgi:guanylate kinase